MENGAARDVLDFWFSGSGLDSPTVDSRMDRWFSANPALDDEIRDRFGDLVQKASEHALEDWEQEPESRLALIILLDQFRRNIYRGEPEAFSLDNQALKLCIEGTMKGAHKHLSPEQRIFFFMPLQHAESLKIQEKSVSIYNALAETVSDTLRETFATCAHFAELHRDIIEEFGRFPHRNAVLGRENTAEETAYLSGNAPAFGQ